MSDNIAIFKSYKKLNKIDIFVISWNKIIFLIISNSSNNMIISEIVVNIKYYLYWNQ